MDTVGNEDSTGMGTTPLSWLLWFVKETNLEAPRPSWGGEGLESIRWHSTLISPLPKASERLHKQEFVIIERKRGDPQSCWLIPVFD